MAEVLESVGEGLPDLIDGLLEHRKIMIRDLTDYAAIDGWQARSIVSTLVRQRALTKEHTYYVKRQPFRILLQHMKEKLADPTRITGAEGVPLLSELRAQEQSHA